MKQVLLPFPRYSPPGNYLITVGRILLDEKLGNDEVKTFPDQNHGEITRESDMTVNLVETFLAVVGTAKREVPRMGCIVKPEL